MRYRDMRALGMPTKRSDAYRLALRRATLEAHNKRPLRLSVRRPIAPPVPPAEHCGPPCYWCGEPTDLRRNDSPCMATREHLVPRKYGGYTATIGDALRAQGIAPVVTACKSCNGIRGHEQDGRWLKFPEWVRAGRAEIVPSQQRALARRGLL